MYVTRKKSYHDYKHSFDSIETPLLSHTNQFQNRSPISQVHHRLKFSLKRSYLIEKGEALTLVKLKGYLISLDTPVNAFINLRSLYLIQIKRQQLI